MAGSRVYTPLVTVTNVLMACSTRRCNVGLRGNTLRCPRTVGTCRQGMSERTLESLNGFLPNLFTHDRYKWKYQAQIYKDGLMIHCV